MSTTTATAIPQVHVPTHPGPGKYVFIGVILAVLTGLEIVTSYADIGDNLMILLLLGMAIVKFVIVAAYFMHLRFDIPLFRKLFIMGIAGALGLYAILLASLHAF